MTATQTAHADGPRYRHLKAGQTINLDGQELTLDRDAVITSPEATFLDFGDGGTTWVHPDAKPDLVDDEPAEATTPVEIATQIKDLYIKLAFSLADDQVDEWDGDYAALLDVLSAASEHAATVFGVVAKKDFDDADWDTAVIRIDRAAVRLGMTAEDLSTAAELAQRMQDSAAAEIDAARAAAL